MMVARAALFAVGWVGLFTAFHLYWYLGGSAVDPGDLPGAPHGWVGWIFELVVVAAFVLGFVVPAVIIRGRAVGRLTAPVAIVLWSACAILVLRGGAGVIDDLTRATGIVANGLTGISTKDATGADSVTASSWAIDVYFLVGGMVFTWLAISYRRSNRQVEYR